MTALSGHPVEKPGECRRCGCYCDKLIDPADCLAAGCPFLYAYDDEDSGKRYLGCLHKVFRAEVDASALLTADGRRRRLGGVRATGQPLAHCPCSIERAFEGSGAWYRCVNPDFWAIEEREPALDLRDFV